MDNTAIIHAATKRQALDWSLVLASQGIEATIEKGEEGFALIVPAESHQAAMDSIQKYRAENRSWPWRHFIFRQGIIFDWGSLSWVALIVLFHWLGSHRDLVTRGMMDSAAVVHGEWWRLFTAVWLHADIGHLATNAAFGFVLLGLAMGRFGIGPALAAAYLAGVGGNLFAWAGSVQAHRSLVASGAVMGCLGMLAVQSLVLFRRSAHGRRLLMAGIASGVLLFVLLGLNPEADVLAHLGGFVSGLFVGAVLVALGDSVPKPSANFIGGIAFVLLVIVPWYFALRSSG